MASLIAYSQTIQGLFPDNAALVQVPPAARSQPLAIPIGGFLRVPLVVNLASGPAYNLTGTAPIITLKGGAQRSLKIEGTVDVGPGQAHFDFLSAYTAGWETGAYRYDIVVKQTDGTPVFVVIDQPAQLVRAEYVDSDPVILPPVFPPLGQAPISTTPQPGTQSIWQAENALWINGGGIFGGEIILSQNGVPLVTLFAPNGLSTQAIRFQRSQGAQISSGSATIAPGIDGDLFQATGHGTNILQMITTGFQAGADVDLEFVDTTPVTIKHMGAAVGATTAPFFLQGSADLVTTGRSCLVRFRLVASGGNFVYWREVCRSLG